MAIQREGADRAGSGDVLGLSRPRPIGPDEFSAGSVVRAIGDQVDRAVRVLEDGSASPDRAVHEAVRALRRSRGLLRLIGDPMERPTHTNLNHSLCTAGRELGPMREATTLLETFISHRALFAEWVSADILDATRACIEARHTEAFPDHRLDGEAVEKAQKLLGRAGRLLAAWVDKHASFCANPESFSRLVHGVHRVYKGGRDEMRAATLSGDFNELHLWRKQMKYLRYQLEHLEPLHPAAMASLIGDLKRVDGCLGDAHDLWVLGNFIDAHPCDCIDRDLREAYVGVTDERRYELNVRALALGAPLYAEQPGEFVERIESYWGARRSGRARYLVPGTAPAEGRVGLERPHDRDADQDRDQHHPGER